MAGNNTMTSEAELLPCPFCCQPMTISKGLNSHGRCDTKGCFINRAALGVATDEPAQVAAWNTRATHPVQGEAVAWQRLRTVGTNIGWVPVDPEDIPHYRSVGQEIRGLYAAPPPVTGEGVRQRVGDQCLRAGFAFWVGAEDKAVEKMADELIAAREALAALTANPGGEG
jgi:hypothetical protein